MTYKHKSGLLTAIILILVVALIVGALAAMSSGFTNWDTSTWFGRGETAEKGTEVSEPTGQENMIVGIGANNGMTLRMAPVTVMDAATGEARVAGQTVSVVSPLDIVDYNWSLSWSGSGNVSDYVTISSSTGTSVTVTCNQAFGSKITLTCKAMSGDTEVSSATCTLDYVQRLTGLKLNGQNINSSLTLSSLTSLGFKDACKSDGFTFEVTPVFSAGTIEVDDYEISIIGRSNLDSLMAKSVT